MTDADTLFQQGLALHQSGDSAGASARYAQALAINPSHFDALHMTGVLAFQAKDYPRALDLIGKAIAIDPGKPDYAPAYSNRASVHKALDRFDLALADLDQALALGTATAPIHFNRANALFGLLRFSEAAEAYRRAIALAPNDPAIHNNLGITLGALNRHGEALASFENAVRARPGFAAAHNNIGLSLNQLGRVDEALAAYAMALDIAPKYADALSNRAGTSFGLGRHTEAVADYDRLLAVNPNYRFAAGLRLHSKMYICDWRDVEAETAALSAGVAEGKPLTPSWLFSALSDSAPLQRKAAEAWSKLRHPADPALGRIAAYPKHAKIRLGYYSNDFYSHATAYLLAEVFERHDRDKFEITAFDFSPSQDAVHTRLTAAFDRFIDVRAHTDRDVAALSRTLEIDIAVDLKGYTTGYRAGIFAARAAPLQVAYIGTAGTLGAPFIDYVLADSTVIPPADFAHFTEKVVHLPASWYTNDSKRPLSDKRFTRAELGLPDNAFVFCCFNNNFKITPAVFGIWMEILRRVPLSVLWLFEDNALAAANLRKEASARGIDPARLVFARRAPPGEHLARHRAADLFLDTLPYNAHTTAVDALWMGVPIVTRPGDAFAARVAASLLKALDLPELITRTPEAYADLAVSLATDPARLAALKAKLARHRTTAPLFDAALFTRGLEQAYIQMVERHRAGLPPDHFAVSAA